MKPNVLVQLDADTQPSVFDAIVGVDAGVAQLLRHGGVKPADVRGLVHGALFTRGADSLKHSALFIGGSDVEAGEALLDASRKAFFGPFRVSVMFDANGCNTTAAAAVLALLQSLKQSRKAIEGVRIAVLGATGAVGQRIARLLLGLAEKFEVRVGSRRLDRAQAVAALLKDATGRDAVPMAAGTDHEVAKALEGAQAVVAAGAAGVTLLRKPLWGPARVLIDLNAVPPVGIEGVEPADRGNERDGALCWGALGVGATKMKIHKRALQSLFESNDRVIDAEECLEIGRGLRDEEKTPR